MPIERSAATDQLLATVLIPTYRRPHFLIRVLESVAAQECDNATFQVIVVDNNSKDETMMVCERFAQSHPSIQFAAISETRQGLSQARNRGLAEAAGKIICILDDDAAPVPTWLAAVLQAFTDEEVGAAGGPMIPDYLGQERPQWLEGDLQGVIGGYSLPYSKPTPVNTRSGSPAGGNMALRKSVFASVGQFRYDLDPSGTLRVLGGETELFRRMEEDGWKILYVPDAVVRHFVPAYKLRKSYLYEECRRRAASNVIATLETSPRRIARSIASDLWFTLRLFLNLVRAWLTRQPNVFDEYIRFWTIAQRLPIRIGCLMRRQYSRDGILARVPEVIFRDHQAGKDE
jgi:glucosyl-dolichyl phosphate glucuronosyltransferase